MPVWPVSTITFHVKHRRQNVAEKRRLGRGLDALIPTPEEDGSSAEGVREVPLKKIELNPEQPRAAVDPDKLQELADSIRSSGVIQPVLVRPAGAMFELVVGERRIRAARIAGLEAVPAIVRDVPDDRMLELALVENIQRSDLNAIEKARAVSRMISELDLTQEETGRRLGLSRSNIANTLRLLDLSEDLQEMVSRETLSAGHARALLALEAPSDRTRLAERGAEKGLSVRETEKLAARGGVTHKTVKVHEPSPNVARLEESLSEALGTRVEVKPQRKGGKIVIRFRDHDDFERLYELLTREPVMDYPAKIPA